MQCHVTVQFPGWPPMHYHADFVAAHTFAKALYELRVATIQIDQDMREAMRPMPYQRLWR
ncbi:hypothetical protein FB390_4683 [Nocardia bhagyanarayanae]|uniref:Uncharacterized protein n=1 Tax=Nocardia bhagyanarayanae TaxID=1215925 RepID=A0A543FGH4_9NOCA|nr:hypothetical protein FB390_4683 [Nocardia bhagyanarayanae]